MAKVDINTIERYQKILDKDPQSQVFAPLSEAYREMGMLIEAETLARNGVRYHPQFASGLVTLAKILKEQDQFEEALSLLTRAIKISAENILAHQLRAEIYLAQQKPKEALKAYKMVLFLNPQSQSAQKAVKNLESISAEDFDEDQFSMSKLTLEPEKKNQEFKLTQNDSSNEFHNKSDPDRQVSKQLERALSLIDAFIIRHDYEKAIALINDARQEYGEHPELNRRSSTIDHHEVATPIIAPQQKKHKRQQQQLDCLEMLLRKIEKYQLDHSPLS